MITSLRAADTSLVMELAKKYGASDATIYAWRKGLGALKTVDMKRLRDFPQQNITLKRFLGERKLVIQSVREVAAKK